MASHPFTLVRLYLLYLFLPIAFCKLGETGLQFVQSSVAEVINTQDSILEERANISASYVYFERGHQVKIYRPALLEKIRLSSSYDDYNLVKNLDLDNLRCIKADSKSGQMFWVSKDGKLVIKTIKAYECRNLRDILDTYYQRVSDVETRSTIAAVVGLFRCKRSRFFWSRPTYYLVCRNVYPSPEEDAHCNLKGRYDLKGSLVGRKAAPMSPVAKDLDLIQSGSILQLGEHSRAFLLRALEKDVAFLESCGFMDYSLLVGVEENYRKNAERFRIHPDGTFAASVESLIPDDQGKLVVLGIDGCAYHFGIIDFLQRYTFRKLIETWIKSFFSDGSKISCVRPEFYAKRMLRFISQYTR